MGEEAPAALPGGDEPARRLPAAADWFPFAEEPSEAPGPREDAQAADWLPEGMESVAPEVTPPAAAPPPPAAAPPPPAAAPPPPASASPPDPAGGAEALRSRLGELEEQMAAAQRRAETLETGAGEKAPPPPGEVQAVAESYRALDQAVHRLRTRLDDETSEQRETIVELQERLGRFERDLRKAPPAWPKPATRAATAIRILLLLILFVVIACTPLFATRRESCVTHHRYQTHWSVVAPFSSAHPAAGCRAESGETVLLKALGFE